MTVFLILTTITYGIFNTGGFILLVVKRYQSWTLFWKNYDHFPHIIRSRYQYQRRFILRRIWKRLKTGQAGSSNSIPRPASNVVITILVSPDFHLRMVPSSTSSSRPSTVFQG
ncbi:MULTISPECIES: hypothetical protein [Escherichia]|uniref:hypothetical protein n=1 Tax=Escherichia TaxID=561 RepID=UPI00200A52DC|nr:MULTISPECIES: hypothetical protein [Escherichia]MED0414362.1 hypothetical protein [Escherichia marmotae]MEC9878447.1 hypothetical protein [Escherichia ruysiae]MEC9886752.1 hypothetical protein [Escherichia ruysiae]MED9040602.1 hypothetical protein [Escherichia ruysiae]MED9474256.1 hypothetical protein [Escherichia ruysiae]